MVSKQKAVAAVKTSRRNKVAAKRPQKTARKAAKIESGSTHSNQVSNHNDKEPSLSSSSISKIGRKSSQSSCGRSKIERDSSETKTEKFREPRRKCGKVDRENGQNIEYALRWDGHESDFSGNENDEGSVVSGILDEDLCYMCGESTLLCPDEWGKVILCDLCEGEYHLRCEGLTSLPEGNFTCSRCRRDEKNFSLLDFNFSNQFKVPTSEPNAFVYSPAKPLPQAWEECKRKGLMVVADLLPFDVMAKLTHGTVLRQTAKGRIADHWQGAVHEVTRRISAVGCHGLIDREGRYDLKLPDYVVKELKLPLLLEPVLEKLRGIMGHPAPEIRTHNVVFVPIGSRPQQWHVDDRKLSRKSKQRYFTILVHLNPLDANSGGTEVWMEHEKKGDLIRARPGDALVFSGSLLHRGHANYGSGHRFFYYASFACGADANAGS